MPSSLLEELNETVRNLNTGFTLGNLHLPQGIIIANDPALHYPTISVGCDKPSVNRPDWNLGLCQQM
jgi:hypothetical protein